MPPRAYQPFEPTRRPGGKPPRKPRYRVLVHRQYEELWDALQAYFDDGEIVEIATVIGLFNFFNRYADALQILPPKSHDS